MAFSNLFVETSSQVTHIAYPVDPHNLIPNWDKVSQDIYWRISFKRVNYVKKDQQMYQDYLFLSLLVLLMVVIYNNSPSLPPHRTPPHPPLPLLSTLTLQKKLWIHIKHWIYKHFCSYFFARHFHVQVIKLNNYKEIDTDNFVERSQRQSISFMVTYNSLPLNLESYFFYR